MNDLLGERARASRATDEDVWFDVFNNGKEIDNSSFAREFVVVPCVRCLSGCEFIAMSLDAQSVTIDKPESGQEIRDHYQICFVACALDNPSRTIISLT